MCSNKLWSAEENRKLFEILVGRKFSRVFVQCRLMNISFLERLQYSRKLLVVTEFHHIHTSIKEFIFGCQLKFRDSRHSPLIAILD